MAVSTETMRIDTPCVRCSSADIWLAQCTQSPSLRRPENKCSTRMYLAPLASQNTGSNLVVGIERSRWVKGASNVAWLCNMSVYSSMFRRGAAGSVSDLRGISATGSRQLLTAWTSLIHRHCGMSRASWRKADSTRLICSGLSPSSSLRRSYIGPWPHISRALTPTSSESVGLHGMLNHHISVSLPMGSSGVVLTVSRSKVSLHSSVAAFNWM